MIKLLHPNNFHPLLIWQGLAGAVAGAAGNLIGSALNAKEARRQREWQTNERLASQQYNTSERLASQTWQDMQRVAQNQYSEDIYNKYQSPESMVKQYQAAGINPAAALDNMSGGSISASSGSSGGAPSGTHVGTPNTGAPFQNVGAWAESFAAVANALKSLGDAKRTGIETKYYERQILAQIRGAELENDFRALHLDIDKVFAKPMARAAYEKLGAEIAKTNMDVQIAEKQVDILVSQGQMAKDEAEQFKEQLRLNRAKTSAEINEINKRADVHVGEKFLKEEQAKTESFNRSEIAQRIKESNARIDAMNVDNKLKYSMRNLNMLEYEIRRATSPEEKKSKQAQFQKEFAEAYRRYHDLKPDIDAIDSDENEYIASMFSAWRNLLDMKW